MKKLLLTLFFLIILVFTSQLSFAAIYDVDPDHSTVSFKIRHLFSKVEGRFQKFQGTFEYEPGKPETWKTSGTIEAVSIDTNVAKRDAHLRSADFFDVEKFPTIDFKSVKVTEVNEAEGWVKGDGLI